MDPRFIKLGNVQIISDNSVLFRTIVNGKTEWKWYSFAINDLKPMIVSSCNLCAINPSESIQLINFADRLLFIDIEKKSPIGNHGYPDDCMIYSMFWMTDDIAYIVTSAGLLMFQPSDADSLTLMTKFDELIDASEIYNVQLNEKSGFYIIQMRKGNETRIQYGNVSSVNWTVKDGSASCLFTPNNDFVKDIVCISYVEKMDNESNYLFHTEVLKGESDLKASRAFSLPPEQGIPLFMHCDPKSCLATVATDKGHLMVFDALNGMLIGSTDQSLEVVALREHSEGGFFFLGQQSCQVSRCVIEPSTAISSYQIITDTTLEPFHLACRFGLPNTNFEPIRDLLEALFFNNTKKAKEFLLKTVGTLNVANTKAFKRLIHQNRTFRSIKNCIASHFSMGEKTDWPTVIHQWCEDFCIESPDEEEFLCFNEAGEIDVDATLECLMEEKRELQPERLFQLMKTSLPDPFHRAKVILQLSNRKRQKDEERFHTMAMEMKENDVRVGDEYWEAIMEEAFASAEEREKGEKGIRKYMYWHVCCV